MSAVELDRDEARWLSVLVAGDLRRDDEHGWAGAIHQRNVRLHEKLQTACAWDEGDED